MKLTKYFILFSLPLTLCFATPPEGYELVWADEFDGEGLDESVWDYRTDSKHWSTQLPDNVEVSDGNLKLHLKKEQSGGKEYTGAGVISKEPFKYGYYEARFKIPPGAGWHTSFWLMFHDKSGSTFGSGNIQEIDVCENDSLHKFHYKANLHNWKGKHINFKPKRVNSETDLSEDYHVWGCEFTPTSIKYYFEGELVDERDATVLEHGPQHIWLTSIASHLGGTKAVDDTQLPAVAEFDYVRFYTKTDDEIDGTNG